MRIKSIVVIVCFSVFLISCPPVKVNTETKTIVVPDDYATVAAAIGNASAGDTIYVKTGTYDGPINQTLLINKTISLRGENPKTTILTLHPAWVFQGWESPMTPVYGYESSIEVTAKDVEISGFTFKGNGNFYVVGHNARIINNMIRPHVWLVGSKGNASLNDMGGITVGGTENTVSNNLFTGGIDLRFGSGHVVCDNLVTNGSCIGLVESSNNKIFRNTVKNCTIGIAVHLVSSGNSVYENLLLNNEIGFAIHVDGSNNVVYENYVGNNSCGINIGRSNEAGQNTSFHHNNFVDNLQQVNIEWRADGYGLIFDNGNEGNYWSNYNGTDSNKDGIGDTPYIIDDNNQDNYPLLALVEIESIPESPSWIVLPFFVVTTIIIIVCRNRLGKK